MSDRLISTNWEKFLLICKPEQSGKTFIMIKEIIDSFVEPVSDKEIINFILCDNNLLLTKQTSERVRNDLRIYQVDGETYLEFSSSSATDYNTLSSVFTAIVSDNRRNIICCTNNIRINDIYEIIEKLEKARFTKDCFEYKIWLDEADKFTSYIDNTLIPLSNKYENIEIKLITATPERIFKKYSSINVLPLEDTVSEEYHGWKDNEIILIDHEVPCTHFVEHVMKNFVIPEKLNKPNTLWFIPGETNKNSHNKIKEICKKYKFATIIVNGDGIKVTIPDKFSTFIYKKDDLLHKKISYIYKKHFLHRYPVAITGNICIGRGLSIINPERIIDFAILSSFKDKANCSQIAGRLKSNMKKWDIYKKPIVFTTERFDKVATEMENKSRKLAKIAHQKIKNGELPTISSSEYKSSIEPFIKSIPVRLIIKNEIIKQLKTFWCNKNPRNYKKQLDNLLKKYILSQDILINDKNKVPFDITQMKLNSVRGYIQGDSVSARRFKSFVNAFKSSKNNVGQSSKIGQYNIDFAFDDYECDGFINERNIAWITYKYKNENY